MSRISVSKSFAVLAGVESYTRAKRKVKEIRGVVKHKGNKIVHPEKGEMAGRAAEGQVAKCEKQSANT